MNWENYIEDAYYEEREEEYGEDFWDYADEEYDFMMEQGAFDDCE